MIRILYILLLFLTLTASAQEKEDASSDSLHTDVHAALVVITPGETPSTMFGHMAIRMWCPSAGLDYCFTEKIPEWGNDFITGVFRRVREGIIPEETKMFRDDYRKEGRGITEYELKLSLKEKQRLWMLLDKEFEKGLAYDLDYITRGCATIATNMVLGATYERQINLTPYIDKYIEGNTRRDIVLRYIDFNSWNGFIGHSIFGGTPDDEVSGDAKLIMPQDVITVFDAANLIHGKNVICHPTVKAKGDSCFSPLVFAILFLILCFVKTDIIDYPVMALHTFLGLFLCTVVFISNAPGTEWNWLVVVFNPVVSVLFWFRNKNIHWAIVIVTMAFLLFMIIKLDTIFCISQMLIVGGFLIREIYKIINVTQN